MKQKSNPQINNFAKKLEKHLGPYILPIIQVNQELMKYIKTLEERMEVIEKTIKVGDP